MVGDIKKLQSMLDKQLYGQNLAKEIAVNALRAQWHGDYSQKALTLCFHGSLETSKNYDSKMIIASLYSKGSRSKYVHCFQGKRENQAESYKVLVLRNSQLNRLF